MMDTDPDLKLVNTTQDSTAMDRNTFACHDFKTHGSSFQQHSPSMLKLKDETFITPNGLNHFKHHCLKPCYVKLTKLETIPSHKISCFVKYGGNTSNNVDIPCKPTPVKKGVGGLPSNPPDRGWGRGHVICCFHLSYIFHYSFYVFHKFYLV